MNLVSCIILINDDFLVIRLSILSSTLCSETLPDLSRYGAMLFVLCVAALFCLQAPLPFFMLFRAFYRGNFPLSKTSCHHLSLRSRKLKVPNSVFSINAENWNSCNKWWNKWTAIGFTCLIKIVTYYLSFKQLCWPDLKQKNHARKG